MHRVVFRELMLRLSLSGGICLKNKNHSVESHMKQNCVCGVAFRDTTVSCRNGSNGVYVVWWVLNTKSIWCFIAQIMCVCNVGPSIWTPAESESTWYCCFSAHNSLVLLTSVSFHKQSLLSISHLARLWNQTSCLLCALCCETEDELRQRILLCSQPCWYKAFLTASPV